MTADEIREMNIMVDLLEQRIIGPLQYIKRRVQEGRLENVDWVLFEQVAKNMAAFEIMFKGV